MKLGRNQLYATTPWWVHFGLSDPAYSGEIETDGHPHNLVIDYLKRHPLERARWFFTAWRGKAPEYFRVLTRAEREARRKG